MIPLLLLDVLAAAAQAPIKEPFQFPLAVTLLYVFGFIAAVVGGSLAWYNSKRPPGWEGSDRPDFVPKLPEDKPAEASDANTPEDNA